jgi:hypothetical protein
VSSILGGMGGGREYVLKIVSDVTDAIKGVDQVADKTTSFKDKAVGIGKGVAAALGTAAVIKFGTDTINAAADADDAADAIASAFGDSAGAIEGYAKTADESMGLSTTAYENAAAEVGRILTGMGVDQGKAATDTGVIMQRAADAAAIWGISTDEAAGLIAKGIAGQTRGLKQYGINIDEAKVKARAMAEGYVDASGKVTDAGKAIARQEEILDATNKYQGEFAKNSGDLGSQQDILKAKFENLQASIGEKLLPVVLQLFDVIKPLINFIASNSGWLIPLAAGILAIVGAVKLWNVAQIILNSTLLANPIFQVIAAITALVAGLIWAYNNVGWFRNAVDAMARGVVASFTWIKDVVAGVFNWIRSNWPLLLAILTGPFGAVVLIVVRNWETIKNAIVGVYNWIRQNWPTLLAILTGPFGLAMLAIVRNWDAIKNAIGSALSWVGSKMSTVYNTVSTPFRQAWQYISQVGGWIKDLFSGIPRSINNAMSNLANIIKYPFTQAFNAIRNAWNATVGGFGFSIPSWVPGIGGRNFSIPSMATGGIVSKPTIALIGEAGPEAVVPLSQLTRVNPAESSSPANIVINVYAMTANAEVGRKVWEALREYERINGAIA